MSDEQLVRELDTNYKDSDELQSIDSKGRMIQLQEKELQLMLSIQGLM